MQMDCLDKLFITIVTECCRKQEVREDCLWLCRVDIFLRNDTKFGASEVIDCVPHFDVIKECSEEGNRNKFPIYIYIYIYI